MKFSESLMKRIGSDVIAMIDDNIEAGHDYEGKGYAYSTKPFWRPWDPTVIRKLGGKAGEGTFYKTVFSRKTGAVGLIILGGYKAYKERMNPEAAGNFLTWSGKLLRNLKPLTVSDSSVSIGWTDPTLAQRAFWMNVSGVGRSRKVWKFLGITGEQKDRLTKKYEPEVGRQVAVELLSHIIKK